MRGCKNKNDVSPKKSIQTSINDFFAQENKFESPIGWRKKGKRDIVCRHRREISRNAIIGKSLSRSFRQEMIFFYAAIR
jgi:hypothetical protein